MSEALKKLKEEREERIKRELVMPLSEIWKKYPFLRGKSTKEIGALLRTPEELDRLTEEARKKEEQAKSELGKVMSEVSKRTIKLLKEAQKEEEEAPETYRELAKALETLDEPVLANTLRRIAMEEEMHYAHIRDIVTSLEKRYEHKK